MAQLDSQLSQAAQNARVFMTWDDRRERPVVGYECPTQLSAVWLQFATAVNEDLHYGRCPECGTWFEVAPQVARSSRKISAPSPAGARPTASGKTGARRMATEGMTVEQIAEALDSETATVRRWITGIKE